METLYSSITGITSVVSVGVSSSHSGGMSSATIECISHTLDIGDLIQVNLGYVTDHGIIFTGYVKEITRDRNTSDVYTITASDVLIRASDYFIVSSTPDNPLTYSSKSPEYIIGQLLNMAGLTTYYGANSSYVWGVTGPIEIQLVSSYDYSKMLADMIAWGLWADEGGTIYFEERKPYLVVGDTIVATILNPDIISYSSWFSDSELRNKVVVWGSTGIHATASASSPHLPGGFYKTAVVSAPGIIDTQSMAQSAANYNLSIYNKLTIGYFVTVIGNHLYNARRGIHLNYNSKNLYIYSSQHSWSRSGYTCNLELREEE